MLDNIILTHLTSYSNFFYLFLISSILISAESFTIVIYFQDICAITVIYQGKRLIIYDLII